MSLQQRRFASDLRKLQKSPTVNPVEVDRLFDQYKGMVPLNTMRNMVHTAGFRWVR